MSLFQNATYLASAHHLQDLPPPGEPEVAFAGRSNAGKSSTINALLARKAMARTSRTPGRTQLFNYFQVANGQRLLDLPGYGHAAVNAATRASWGPLGDALRHRASFVALLLVVDIRRGVLDEDLAMLEWTGLPPGAMHVLLAKADKLPHAQRMQAQRTAEHTLAGRASCQLFSAHEGLGVDAARGVLRQFLQGS